MSTSYLDGSFIGFSSTVTEKGLVGSRIGTQPAGQCGLFRNEIQVGDMVDLFHLVFNGFGEKFIVVSQDASGDPTNTI
jgi:hypothetical protein